MGEIYEQSNGTTNGGKDNNGYDICDGNEPSEDSIMKIKVVDVYLSVQGIKNRLRDLLHYQAESVERHRRRERL